MPPVAAQQQQTNPYQNHQSPHLDTNNQNHKKALKQIFFLGIFFLLLTLTYSSFSTIITYIYQRYDGFEYLGPLLLVTNYSTFMFCNILAPFVKISYKKQLIIGAICYTINYALEIPALLNPFGIFLLILGSILGGLGAAIVWVSQGGFMIALLQKYNRSKIFHGRYFGILNMIVFSNILLGSLVTTFGLGFMGDTEYFIILTVIGGLSVCFSVFFLEDVQAKDQSYKKFNEQIQGTTKNQSQQISQSEDKGLIFMQDMNVLASIKEIFEFSQKMKNFLPMIITDGVILGFISSSATHLLPQDHYSRVQAGVFLIFLGVGAILGGFVSGFLSDKIPIMKVGKSTFLVLGISMFLSLPLFMELIENFVYSYFLGFAWGFAWHYMDGWLWVTCSKIFEGKLQSFALNKFIHSLSFVIYQIILIIYGTNDSLKFIEFFFFVLLALMVFSLIFIIKQENQFKVSRHSTIGK